jgi:lipid II:glycine glycyltransferase (peptidoglycan interpeptide bridge formation enzyme)
MSDKKLYREFCTTEQSIPIFSRDWWLDAVCGKDKWDVIVIKKSENIVAALPFFIVHGRLFTTIGMPPLTQILGPWLQLSKSNYADRLSEQKKMMSEIIDRLPPYDYFTQNFHYSIANWLPFYWKGFSQTTRYTYVIDNLNNLDKVWENFSYAKIKNINKAEKIVTVKYDLPAKEFYNNHKMTLAKKNENISYSFELFEQIYMAGYSHNAAKTIYATDEAGNIHAALFVIWDSQSAYDLISSIDPDFRNSGAATLLVKEIIKYVSTRTRKFDFEGSMIEGVENSFRQFGTVQRPYFSVYKTNSRLLMIKQNLASIWRTVRQK